MDTIVEKSHRVIEFMARAGGPVRLSVIADQLGLHRSNVHRLLSTLIKLGYVTQEAETSRYALTLRLWEFGAAVLATHPAKRAATPYMQALHKATSETVSLVVLDGDDVLYLDKIQAPRGVRFTTRPGARAPAALVASGKAMLAFEADPRPTLERTALAAPNGQRLDVDALMAELVAIRRKGYATSESSWTPGIISIAAPIMGRDGRAPAALSVSGPTERLGPERVKEVIEVVLDTSARIAEGVGSL